MDEAESFLGVMFTALALALLISAVVAWSVARSIVRQLGAEPTALAEVASYVAQGGLLASRRRPGAAWQCVGLVGRHAGQPGPRGGPGAPGVKRGHHGFRRDCRR